MGESCEALNYLRNGTKTTPLEFICKTYNFLKKCCRMENPVHRIMGWLKLFLCFDPKNNILNYLILNIGF